MTLLWIMFVCSVVVLPALALWALRWAVRQGQFADLQKTALSIFDEDEPVGRVTDHFPGQTAEEPESREPGCMADQAADSPSRTR